MTFQFRFGMMEFWNNWLTSSLLITTSSIPVLHSTGEFRIHQMPDRQQGPVQHHPRSSIAHYHFDFFSPIFFVTMNRAFGTNRFFCPKPAVVETSITVCNECFTIFTQIIFRMMMCLAIQGDHTVHCLFLSFNPCFCH